MTASLDDPQFKKALQFVESLPPHQQDNLIRLVRQRRQEEYQQNGSGKEEQLYEVRDSLMRIFDDQ